MSSVPTCREPFENLAHDFKGEKISSRSAEKLRYVAWNEIISFSRTALVQNGGKFIRLYDVKSSGRLRRPYALRGASSSSSSLRCLVISDVHRALILFAASLRYQFGVIARAEPDIITVASPSTLLKDSASRSYLEYTFALCFPSSYISRYFLLRYISSGERHGFPRDARFLLTS